ncbi:MAG: hypothetical protein LBQ36_04785, partial [Synergistaceae bacterium]|nr:hypothetical protein [Synergistaceae bacterium]
MNIKKVTKAIKISILTVITVFGFVFAAGNLAEAATKLTVSAAAVPHAELLEFVKPKLAEQGIDLVIVVIDESVGGTLLNEQTDNGENDVNFFQHV